MSAHWADVNCANASLDWQTLGVTKSRFKTLVLFLQLDLSLSCLRGQITTRPGGGSIFSLPACLRKDCVLFSICASPKCVLQWRRWLLWWWQCAQGLWVTEKNARRGADNALFNQENEFHGNEKQLLLLKCLIYTICTILHRWHRSKANVSRIVHNAALYNKI